MSIAIWDMLKIQFKAMTQYHPGRLVSKGFWSLCVGAWVGFAATQWLIGLSCLVRVILLDKSIPGAKIQIHAWEQFLAWPTLVIAFLFYASYLCLSKTRELSTAKADFLADKGDTLLSRAAYEQSASRPRLLCPSMFGLLLATAIAALMIVSLFMGALGSFYFASFVLTTLTLIAALAFFIYWVIDYVGQVLSGKNALVSAIGVVTEKLSSIRALDRKFQQLPSVEKQLLIARAHQLGADPDSAPMKRAAIQDYHQRVAQAQGQAAALSTATPTPTTPQRPAPRL